MSVPVPLRLATLLAVISFGAPAGAQTSGANQTHDPSRMIESEGKFYVYSTGGGSKSSADALFWTAGPSLFPNGFPQWLTTLFPTNQGVWAPDVIYLNGQYWLYYSVAGSPATSACVIGLLTSPTLNPNSPSYKWTDRGLVVQNPANTTAIQYATIDPAPILDLNGNLWVGWGSGYGKNQSVSQLWTTRMDEMTGLPGTVDPAYQPPGTPGHPLEAGRKEGSYMHYHNGYFYLFYNEGSCCDGTSSTYTIWVARSQNVTGPFAGDKVFYGGSGNIHGPGHMGVYSACGVERFTYHYYPTAVSVLGENELSWSTDGWPVAGPISTTPLTPCGDPGSNTEGVDAGEPAVDGGSGLSGGHTDASAADGTNSGQADTADGGGSPTTSAPSGTASGPGAELDSGAAAGIPGGEDAAASATATPASPTGGCGCSLPGRRGREGVGPMSLVAVGVVLGRRKRHGRKRPLRVLVK